MNILYIVPYVPSQIYVRPFNLIKQLALHEHQVSVLTVSVTEDDKKAAHKLREYCHQVLDFPLPTWRSYKNSLLTLPTSNPLQSAYCWQPRLSRFAINLIKRKEVDIIHIEHLRGARYGLAIREMINKTNNDVHPIPIIWDSVDCITHLFQQSSKLGASLLNKLITRFELERTAKYEAKLINEFDHTLVTSKTDMEAMLSLRKNSNTRPKISVLFNGVDQDHFFPDERIARESETLVISGKMSYHANITMVMYLIKEIMPIVWSRKPTVQVCIVGKNPPQSMISLENHPAIKVTGTVDDIRPYLQSATIAVAPLQYGAGIQNKVLEAMSCATPVITSLQGVNALNVKIGEEIIVGNDPITFSQAIINLLERPRLRERIGRAGRRYIEINHNWSDITRKLENIYIETINQSIRSS